MNTPHSYIDKHEDEFSINALSANEVEIIRDALGVMHARSKSDIELKHKLFVMHKHFDDQLHKIGFSLKPEPEENEQV